MKKPVVLAILDGFAIREEEHGNAVFHAKKPNFDMLKAMYPNTQLRADGQFVGLPDGQMGNSEVGHLNIGAGRVVYQSLQLLNKEVATKSLFDNEVLVAAYDNAKSNALHIWGLCSDGGVHAHINHIVALIEMASIKGVKDLYIHLFLDGRDVDPRSSKQYIQIILDAIEKFGVGVIATISGRYYAMDRDKRWDRVELAYDTVVLGQGPKFTDPLAYIDECYAKDLTDEFVLPAVNSLVDYKMNDNDSVVCANFRPDRASQLAAVLTNPEYNPKPEEPIFTPKSRPANVHFVQMMKYSADVRGTIAYIPLLLVDTFGEVVSKAGLNQLRIAETEKYPHVTFFFDGGIEKDLPGAKRILIDSPKVATYDLKPEMSAFEVKDALINEIKLGETDVVILNFANPDMVGHSGMLEPTCKAIEAVDTCLGEIYQTVKAMDGVLVVTADHGNADLVLNTDDSPNTAHTTNPVPFIVTKSDVEVEAGALCDIAPTLLDLLNVEQPEMMTGKSLINGK